MADRLVIPLVRWEPRPACCCYGGTRLPAHSSLLAPDAREAIRALEDRLVLVTGYRDPLASAVGWREDQARPVGRRKGVARPGFSPHGFGLAIDLDVERTITNKHPRRMRTVDTDPYWWRDKADLDGALAAAGFRCWRDDHKKGREWHHYTYGASAGGARAMDAAILARWPDLATPDARVAQRLLQRGGFYTGQIDGDWGPRSRAAMAAWHKRMFGLDVDGRLDRFAWRALLVATADVQIGNAP